MILSKNFYVIKLRRNVFTLAFTLFTFSLLLFSTSNLKSAKDGLDLWATSVVPALFPFFVATELLIHTNFVSILGRCLNGIMRPVFNVPGEGSFALIMGIISGYPIGAKICCDFRKNNICTKEECERLLSFTNNSGPLFIIGTVGISMYHSSTIGILLFISHLLASFIVGVIFRFWKKNTYTPKNKKTTTNTVPTYTTLSNIGEILAISITNSISTVLLIGGFIVLFSCILSILNSSGLILLCSTLLAPLFTLLHIPADFSTGFISGILEITNGLFGISNIPYKKLSINLILTSFVLGFGGISILLQVLSITSKSDLSFKPYIYGKLLQASFSSLCTYILINVFPFFNFDIS